MNRKRILAAILAMAIAIPAAAQSASMKLPKYESVTLGNGMRLLLMEKRDVPMIAFHARIAGGAIADPNGKEGTADLVAELLQKGAGERDALQFSAAADSVGATFGTASTRESLVVTGEFLARDQKLMLELLADALRRPRFEASELEKLRKRMIDGIAAARENQPDAVIDNYFDAFLFGTHPYGRSASETSLAAVTRDDVATWYPENAGADRTILVFVGDFDSKSLAKDVKKAFGDWQKAASPMPKLTAPATRKGRRVLLVDKPDATQTYFRIGNIGIARKDPDSVAVDLVNTAFGGRFTSMLNSELRIRTGLTYGARCYVNRESVPGSVAMSSFTKTESTAEAIDLALATLGRLHKGAIDAATLSSVKAYVAGQYPPRLETGNSLAAKLAEIEAFALGRGEVDEYGAKLAAVTGEGAKSVIERVYPKESDLTFVLIGNAAAIREAAGKYGEITERKITDAGWQ
ncbi:MAG: insulinase family protein [Acidobacteria bacterium]|nr:insulinase family protein [Acidobacteriota bacterium]